MTVPKAQRRKKIQLASANKLTRWAPVWVVIKKFGQGKRIHPSATTHQRRNWRITKLKIKPRRVQKRHLG
jgi:ribosomal protein L39E